MGVFFVDFDISFVVEKEVEFVIIVKVLEGIGKVVEKGEDIGFYEIKGIKIDYKNYMYDFFK